MAIAVLLKIGEFFVSNNLLEISYHQSIFLGVILFGIGILATLSPKKEKEIFISFILIYIVGGYISYILSSTILTIIISMLLFPLSTALFYKSYKKTGEEKLKHLTISFVIMMIGGFFMMFKVPFNSIFQRSIISIGVLYLLVKV